jgi:sugar phosphate isomerase/epimerase
MAHFIGFPGVDVALAPAMKEGAEATRKTLAELKLKPAVVGLPTDFRKDDETFKKSVVDLDAAAKFAADIGCPRMTTWLLPSDDRPKAEWRKILKDRFTEMAAIVNKHKVRLGIEFVSPVHLRKRMKYEFIYRMDEMLEFAMECGPNMGVLLDSWHWHHAEGKISDIIHAGKRHIVHVQIADAPKLPPEEIKDGERLMPGEGIIDFNAFFAALKKIGYQDGVSPEVFGRGLKDLPPEQGAQMGYDMSMKVMKKAGVA